ncbi:MAG: hypothetical protein JXL84_24855 [Deltaproteobacteria bacterium]|nr:hypothetical protein [Deltaproteobacteria bacterium]
MPGFFGLISGDGTPAEVERLFASLAGAVHENAWCTRKEFPLPDLGVPVRLGIVSLHEELRRPLQSTTLPLVLLEGYIYEIAGVPSMPGDASDMRDLLRKLYLQEGRNFVQRLRGSFTLFILEETGIALVTDQTCSRPVYLFQSGPVLAWSPEILPLVKTFKAQLNLNLGNLGQVLCSEFSFPDDTLFREILFLRPGEIFSWNRGIPTRHFYFRFRYDEERFESGPWAGRRIARKLNTRSKEVIRLQWSRAGSPAILLSGGLDSRYVVSAVAEMVQDTTKLTLVTWTSPETRHWSDVEIARLIAKRLGARHIVLQRSIRHLVEELDGIYPLIGCEVDSIFHANERTLIACLRAKYGIESLFRGEEAFGWGPYRRTVKSALNQIIVSDPGDNPLIETILKPEMYPRMIEEWNARLAEILGAHGQKNINDLKDSLYFNWRLARYLNTISYFKLAYTELFNPLLDPEVLEINRVTSSLLRVDKAIFRKTYRAKGGLLQKIPYATRNNLEFWEDAFQDEKLWSYLRRCHAMESPVFRNSSDALIRFRDSRTSSSEKAHAEWLDSLAHSPRVKHNSLFRTMALLRHLLVPPPRETMQVKLIFRAAIVKDFLKRYWG